MTSQFPLGEDGLIDLDQNAKDCDRIFPGYREAFFKALDDLDSTRLEDAWSESDDE